MTDWKGELIEKIAQVIARDDDPLVIEMYRDFARTALAVALPEILERAARAADDEVDGTELGVDGLLMSRKIAAAIRKLWEEK